MFNPENFSAPSVKRSLPLGNSEHPVLEHTVLDSFRLVPKSKDLYYLELKMGKVMTLSNDTLQLHDISMSEFKRTFKDGFNSVYEVVALDTRNRYIGNDVMTYLKDEKLI